MKFLATTMAVLMLASVAIAQTPITTLPYLYDWTNPAPLVKQPDGLTCIGGDGHWGCYVYANAPMFVVDSGAGTVRTNVKDTPATLFTQVDATGTSFTGGEVFAFQASRNGGPAPTGTVEVRANSTVIKTINAADLLTTMQSFSAPLSPGLGNSVFTISLVVNSNKVVSFDNTKFSGGALPITLASFKADLVGESAVLHWSTLSEINNYGFYVQKSQDGVTWTDIPHSFQPGFGTTVDMHSYSFTDNATPLGKYYRLRQVDLDGASNYSEAVSVASVAAVETKTVVKEFSLGQNYPNPFNPTTVVSSQYPVVSDVKLVVYNLLGQEVAVLVNERRAAGRYQDAFSGATLPSGVYFYRLTATDPSAGSGHQFVQTRTMVLAK